MPCSASFLQSFTTGLDAEVGQNVGLGVPFGNLDLKGEVGDVAEDEGAVSLGGDDEALMAGGVTRGGDDGDFVGEVEVAIHQADVVQLLD